MENQSSTSSAKFGSDAIIFIPSGAIIQEFRVGDTDIVLGFPEVSHYETVDHPRFGETIGRVANRISNGRITSLNGGREYPLAVNSGPNTLHGGTVGWGKKLWAGPTPAAVPDIVIPTFDGATSPLLGAESQEFTMHSPDGDEGFPGALDVRVKYTTAMNDLGRGILATVLVIDYEAEIVDDTEETAISMTNHSYGYSNVESRRNKKKTVPIESQILTD